ncbi:hypothetical protein [uncultured Brevundimonas sp.]|uniref:hypothetical protein n=1 Tax=uncultured Brevundimonas sp. TaxID=213418 RepID=UPI0026024867|nr:hypothetical protein [uncultured Brevundimonas sp.]
MWRIVLANAAGETVAELTVEAPFESLRDWCRQSLEARPDAAFARLVSTDGLFAFAYPDRVGEVP